jgi:hypothetical protein
VRRTKGGGIEGRSDDDSDPNGFRREDRRKVMEELTKRIGEGLSWLSLVKEGAVRPQRTEEDKGATADSAERAEQREPSGLESQGGDRLLLLLLLSKPDKFEQLCLCGLRRGGGRERGRGKGRTEGA